MGWEMGGGFRREGTWAYLWLILVDVWEKTTKFCKAIIFQLKKFFKKALIHRTVCWKINIFYPTQCCLVAKLCQTLLRPHALESTRLFCLWDFSGRNTEVGCHFLLQEIFPTREQTWVSCLADGVFTTKSLGKSTNSDRLFSKVVPI